MSDGKKVLENRNADVSRAYERRSWIKSADGSDAIKFADLKGPEFYFQIQRRSIASRKVPVIRLRTRARCENTAILIDDTRRAFRFYSPNPSNLLPLLNKLIHAAEKSPPSRQLPGFLCRTGKHLSRALHSAVSNLSLTLAPARVL